MELKNSDICVFLLLATALMCDSTLASAAPSNSATKIRCASEGWHGSTWLSIVPGNESFTVMAKSGPSELFKVEDVRPSLGARVHDGPSKDVEQFVEFNKNGFVKIPEGAKGRVEISLGQSRVNVLYFGETEEIKLRCRIHSKALVARLGFKLIARPAVEGVKAVGFDIDDTLLASAPTFFRAFATGTLPLPDNSLLWSLVNLCDPGCGPETVALPDGSNRLLPAAMPSVPKSKALELVKFHKALGHEVYAITARPELNGEVVRAYLAKVMGIAPDHVFFEPDLDAPGNPRGKTDRIEALNLDIFYGDSDSDVTDALSAFVDRATGARAKSVRPIRFLREPQSALRKEGKLLKYHPGYYGELIVRDSYY